jgi:hypothetical protein
MTFTATLTSAASGTPAGTVTFVDGSTTLGTATLSPGVSGAVAALSTSSLAAGFHSLVAVYGGNGSFIGSSSASLGEMVQPVSTTTFLSSSANPAAPGQSVTFTATVSSGASGTPSGTVTFQDDSTVLGTASLSGTASGAQATFTTSSLAVGSHAITAVYGGDSSFATSTSAILSEIISDGTTLDSTTTLDSSDFQAGSGQVVTFTATVSGVDGGTATGTVTFQDGSTVLGSATLHSSASGAQASFSTSVLTLGTHTITAVYNGDSNYSASTSPALTQTIVADSGSNAGSGTMAGSTGGDSGSPSGSSHALYRKGQVEEAIASYHKAIKLDPNLAWGYVALGRALVGQGHFRDAQQALWRYQQLLHPGHPDRRLADQLLQQCQQGLDLQPSLEAVLQGQPAPPTRPRRPG